MWHKHKYDHGTECTLQVCSWYKTRLTYGCLLPFRRTSQAGEGGRRDPHEGQQKHIQSPAPQGHQKYLNTLESFNSVILYAICIRPVMYSCSIQVNCCLQGHNLNCLSIVVRNPRRKETEKWEAGAASETWKSNAGPSVAVWSKHQRTASATG